MVMRAWRFKSVTDRTCRSCAVGPAGVLLVFEENRSDIDSDLDAVIDAEMEARYMWHTRIFSRLAGHDNSYVKSYVKSDGLGEIQHITYCVRGCTSAAVRCRFTSHRPIAKMRLLRGT